MANLRPQNLPLSAINRKFYCFSWKILVFTVFKPKWVFFFKWQSSKSQHRPFLLLYHCSFKTPSLFKTVILNAAQYVFKLLLVLATRYITHKSNFVFFQFHLRDDLGSYLCGLLFCYFLYFVFAAGVLFPCTWFLTRYGHIPWFRSEKGNICLPCYFTPTTFIIQLLDPLQSFQFSLYYWYWFFDHSWYSWSTSCRSTSL